MSASSDTFPSVCDVLVYYSTKRKDTLPFVNGGDWLVTQSPQ